MDYYINKRHLSILLGFILVITLFSTIFMIDNNTSLTGYVIFKGGTKISTEKLDSALIEEINLGNNQPKIIVVLEDNPQTTSENIREKKIAIQESQNEVIEDLSNEVNVLEKEEKKIISSGEGTASQEDLEEGIFTNNIPEAEQIIKESINTEFKINQKFETINAFSGEVKNADALLELSQDKRVKKILLDYPVQVDLDESVPRINADDLWDINISGTKLNGSGYTACVIDTGIDYTHSALGGCNPVAYELTGDLDTLDETVESAHPYANGFDQTWTITREGYNNIAIHFVNITLETIPDGGDTTDRIYVYDQNNNTIAIYKGVISNVWTPFSEGDTIYVRLVSDSSVTDYGFQIDKALNGTTMTTMNWNNCSKVVGGWDTYNTDNNPLDDHGHGTHVAGIVASEDSTYRGVAPGAKLTAVKALSATGSGYSSDIIAGIDWCTSNSERLNISTIVMSLGCTGEGCSHHQSYCNNDLTAEVINLAAAKNISVFIAAGNSGWTDGISNPACVESAIPVGGSDSNDGIVYNRGSLLKVLAPGTAIASTGLSNSWVSLSGTSMATPHAAGAAILLQQYYQLVYGLQMTPEQIETKLANTGVTVNDVSGSGLSFNRINLLNAIKPAINYSSSTPTDNSATSNTYTYVEINSDVPLETVYLEVTYPNSSIINLTMSNSSTTEYYYNLTGLTHGTHSYKVYGIDSAGSVGETLSRTILINLYFPAITINTPLSNSYHNSNFYVNFSVNGTNLENVSFNLFNSSGNALSTQNNNSLSTNLFSLLSLINISNFNDGNYTLSVSATDSANNTITENRTIIIDTTDPILNSISYAPTNVETNSTILFTVNINDNNLNNSATVLSVNSTGDWINNTMTLNNKGLFIYNLSTTNFTENQTFYYKVFSTDLAGNLNESSIYNSSSSLLSNTTYGITPGNGTVIELGDPTLFNLTTNITGNLTYLWDFADGTNSTNSSLTKIYNNIGTYNLSLNVSNNSTPTIYNSLIIVNDSTAPEISVATYLSSLHLEKDKNQVVNATITDHSSLSSVKIVYNNTDVVYSDLTNGTYQWSFALFNNTNSFRIEVVDANSKLFNQSYSFTLTSCSDGLKNGDETEVDCGGSCSACTSVVAAAVPAPMPVEETKTEPIALQAESPEIIKEPKNTTPINWTEGIKEQKLNRKETALYVLGSLVILLLGIYLLVSRKL
jgi:subtilisin family serine protease